MTRLVLAALGAVGLILLTAFVASRLVRARSQGISIRMQFFLALASIVGAFAFGLGLLVLDRIGARATLLAESAASDQAGAIAALIASDMETNPTLENVAKKLAGARRGEKSELCLAILAPDGRALFSEGKPKPSPGYVFVTAPIEVRGEEAGRVQVGKPTIVIRQVLTDFVPTILLISSVLSIAAALAAAVIGSAIAKPIEALTEFAVRVAEGERHAAPPPAPGREVQRLSLAIDSMRRQIEGRPFVEAFAADLSHELKNPVAAIRASAEVLADGALDEPEEAARFVRRIQEASSRIEALLLNLLSLARIEARGIEDARVIDLGVVAQAAAARARELGAEVVVRIAPNVRVRGDALWLGRAVDNLIDNARRHGANAAPILVVAERGDAGVSLAVKNAGGVDKFVAKRLFRRFVTTREGKGGTGLGLSIVRAIAEAHAGSARLVSQGPPEVVFQLTLPSA